MKHLKAIALCLLSALLLFACSLLPEVYCSYRFTRLTQTEQIRDMKDVELTLKDPVSDTAPFLTPVEIRDTQRDTYDRVTREIIRYLWQHDLSALGPEKKWELTLQPYVVTTAATMEVLWRAEALLAYREIGLVLWIDDNYFLRGLNLRLLSEKEVEIHEISDGQGYTDSEEYRYYLYENYLQEISLLMQSMEGILAVEGDYSEITRLEITPDGYCLFTIFVGGMGYSGEFTPTSLRLDPLELALTQLPLPDARPPQATAEPSADKEP